MAAPAISEIRARVLDAAITKAGAREGLLFEPKLTDLTRACVTHATPASVPGDLGQGLSTRTLLARWLRVNAAVLRLPEPSGLWTSIPSSGREWLSERSIQACIPLVHEMRLAGWIFVLGGNPWVAADRRMDQIASDMPTWAGALSAAQSQQAAAERAALVSRSNRLSLAGHLAASGTHEIRNSLSGVRSWVQLVLSGDTPAAEHARVLANVLAEVDRANAALSRTLTLGRVHETSRTAIDVSQLVTEAAVFCRAYAHRRRQAISVHTGTMAWIRGDQNELRQVLVNVLLNACQASGDGAVIEMASDITEAGYVTILVSDRGSGMQPELMARAFEPFFSTKQDGGGLGLAISRDIVRQHGGTIVLTSAVGTGTTVTIRLPLGDARGPHTGG